MLQIKCERPLLHISSNASLKDIAENKKMLKFTQAIKHVYEFVSSSDLEKCSIASLAHQWMLCSEWVPSE